MSYTKKESNAVWKDFDKLHNKSIELGFNGHLTQEFYRKLKDVKKVRKKLKSELIVYSICFTIFFLWFCKTDIEIWETMLSGLLCIVLVIAIAKNLLVWNEIAKIREQRVNDYYAEINN